MSDDGMFGGPGAGGRGPNGPSFGWRPPRAPGPPGLGGEPRADRPPRPSTPGAGSGGAPRVVASGPSAPGGPRPTNPVPRRLPVVALLLVFLAAALLVERGAAETASVPPPAVGPATSVSAAGPGDGSAVWFCAAGTARGSAEAVNPRPAPPADVVAEHHLMITNAADAPRRARLTAYPSEGAVVRRDVEVRAHDRLDLDLADVARAPFTSAVVELDGGQVAVAHRLRGPTGESTASCSSTTSRSWFFAAGSTQANTRQLLVLFNPFPQQVVVDVTFQVEDTGGRQLAREPQRLEGLVVPPERPLAVDVTDDVADRRQVSTRVESRDPTARLVADRLLLNPGSPVELPFLSVAPGVSAPRSGWVFADGRPRRTDLVTTFVLYNPSGESVDVELRVRPDRLVAAAEPFRVTVRTGQFQEITLDERVGADAGYWAALVARSNGTFVAERVVRAKPQAPPPPVFGGPALLPAVVDAGGVTFTPGSPVLARQWIVPSASADTGAGLMAVTNLGTTVALLHVEVLVDGRSVPLAGYDGVTLEPGLRTTVDLADPALAGPRPAGGDAGTRRSLRVSADGPVAVEATLAPGGSRGVSDALAVPVRDGLTLLFVDVLALASPAAPPSDEGAVSDPPPSGTAPAPDATGADGPGGTARTPAPGLPAVTTTRAGR
jgi:hypothetical protein